MHSVCLSRGVFDTVDVVGFRVVLGIGDPTGVARKVITALRSQGSMISIYPPLHVFDRPSGRGVMA